MKSFRLEFQKGINVVGDKSVVPPGFLDVAENVDLRSGMPRAFRAPEFLATVPITTTRAFEYRGRWYYSQRWRDYQTEFINGRDRVYFTESGEVAATVTLNNPGKIVEGTQVDLGTKRPQATPYVSANGTLTPIVFSTVTVGDGNYNKNQSTSFRLATRTIHGIQTPSASRFNQINTDGSSVIYNWAAVKGALGYLVFIGASAGSEQKVTELGPSAVSYADTGIIQGNGESASNYDIKNPYTYFYTFVRDVNTVENESAPSDLSTTIETTQARQVVFDVLNDGFFANTNTQYATAGQITLGTSPAYAGTIAISSFLYNPSKVQTTVNLTASHGMPNGGKAYFSGVGSSNWDNKIFDVIADTTYPTVCYVVNVPPPPAGATGVFTPAKSHITIAPAPTQAPSNGDAIYAVISGAIDTTRIFAATAATANGFEINTYTPASATVTSLQYVPHNGYLKYRNLYRTGDTDQYLLVEKVPVTEDRWLDDATVEFIDGSLPDSYYIENGKTVIYDTPPVGMVGLTSHYGMMFGIDGHTVRWTPTNRPDAWPQLFAITFPYKPLALASWGQSLIVLCMDAVYRIDGNIPTQLSLSKTQTENGCVAPHSVQKTHAGLVYLSRRGLMLFNGNTAECLTDTRIPGQFFQGPSTATTVHYWMHPTLLGYNYANLAKDDGIVGVNAVSFGLQDTHAIEGPDFAARSFYHLGKYYLYWTDDSNYKAHTCVVVDLQAQGLPITTLGMKAIDTHVNDVGQAFMLVEDTQSGDLNAPGNNFLSFKDYQSHMGVGTTFTTSGTVSRNLFSFGTNENYVLPYHIRTGDNSLGAPLIKKKFRDVRFHALEERGTLHVRVYIDGRYTCDGESTVSTTPDRVRQVNIPIGKCVGYNIDLEISGEVPLRGAVITYDLLDGTMVN